MPRLRAMNGREVVRVLENAGFAVVRQEGSHVKLRNGEITVVVPVHGATDLKRGTLAGILRDAGLTADDVDRLSK